MNKSKATYKIENNVLKSERIEYRKEYNSLGKFILDRLENNVNLVGQIEAVTSETYTYGKMRDRSISCALWMQAQGLLPGDVVALITHNQMDGTMPCFAALYLGVAVAPLDVTLKTNELQHMFSIAKPKIAFASKECVANVAEASKKANLDIQIVCFGEATGFLDFDQIIAQARTEDIKEFRCTEIKNSSHTAIILGTSGTTGLPKCVPLGHANFLTLIPQFHLMRMADNVCLIFSTLSWITGTICMFMNLYLNIPRLVAPVFEESVTCEIIKKLKVSWMLASPSMLNRLLKSNVKQEDLSSIKYVACGGAILTAETQEAFARYIPDANIFISYGMTELGGPITIQRVNSKFGSCGQIAENAELKVIDVETGRTLGVNQKGELLVKTNTMMSGYYNNPQATADAIDEEGWFHTGDFGYYDEDGEVFLLARLKELIKYRGYQVSPIEIESVIQTHPGVKEVAVVGMTHPVDEEHPIAFVVRATNSSDASKEVTEKEILDLVSNELSDSKRLRGGVRFVDHIPKSATNKIQRNKLRELAKSMTMA